MIILEKDCDKCPYHMVLEAIIVDSKDQYGVDVEDIEVTVKCPNCKKKNRLEGFA